MGKKGMSRRDFLKSSAAGLGGFIYLSSDAKSPVDEEGKKRGKSPTAPYGYRNLGAAQDLLSSLSLASNPCGDCSSCPVQCVNHWKVSDRIQNVVRLREISPEFLV